MDFDSIVLPASLALAPNVLPLCHGRRTAKGDSEFCHPLSRRTFRVVPIGTYQWKQCIHAAREWHGGTTVWIGATDHVGKSYRTAIREGGRHLSVAKVHHYSGSTKQNSVWSLKREEPFCAWSLDSLTVNISSTLGLLFVRHILYRSVCITFIAESSLPSVWY
jgi:hypothetical protein